MLCYWKDFSIGDKLSVAGMAGSMGQAGMGSYYGPAAAYGSLSAASMAAAAAAAAQQSAAAMSAGLAAPAQVSRWGTSLHCLQSYDPLRNFDQETRYERSCEGRILQKVSISTDKFLSENLHS